MHLLSSCKYTQPASWAARHTTVCLDIVDHLIVMGKIGAVRDPSMDDGEVTISYITKEVKEVLRSLGHEHSFNFQFNKFGCLPSLQERQVVRHGFAQSSQVLEGLQVLFIMMA